MLRFVNHPDGLPLLHDQLFTLEWNLDGCKWLLIHYKNGQRKPWYRRTERPYRFQRWFFRKGTGTFSNLANIGSPKIEIYMFSWYIAWPRKLVMPMRVNRLSAHDFQLHTERPEPVVLPFEIEAKTTRIKIAAPAVAITGASPQFRLSSLSLAMREVENLPQFDWPISAWIEKGMINDEALTYEYLQNLNNQPHHV